MGFLDFLKNVNEVTNKIERKKSDIKNKKENVERTFDKSKRSEDDNKMLKKIRTKCTINLFLSLLLDAAIVLMYVLVGFDDAGITAMCVIAIGICLVVLFTSIGKTRTLAYDEDITFTSKLYANIVIAVAVIGLFVAVGAIYFIAVG